MLRNTAVPPAPDMSGMAIFKRLVESGEAEVESNGWAFNKVKSWRQGEFISPALVQDFVEQGLCEKDGSKLVVTEKGRTERYRYNGARTYRPPQQQQPVTSKAKSSRTTERSAAVDVQEVEGEVDMSAPSSSVVPVPVSKVKKLNNDTRVKLLMVGKTRRGAETLFVEIWSKRPNATATVEDLAVAYKDAHPLVADALDTSRFFVRRALLRGEAVAV